MECSILQGLIIWFFIETNESTLPVFLNKLYWNNKTAYWKHIKGTHSYIIIPLYFIQQIRLKATGKGAFTVSNGF